MKWEWEQLIYLWISKKENARFNAALKANGDDAETLIHAWITDYAETHEENFATKIFYEKNPVAKRLNKEDIAAMKLHEEANRLKEKAATLK